jgi:hypothetical protein
MERMIDMKKSSIIVIVGAILLLSVGTALAFSISKKQAEPEIGSYSDDFVAQFVSENKINEQENTNDASIPCYNESELIFENQGCFNLGIDAGSNMASGFRTDFLEKTVKMYPGPLVRENEDYIYLVYCTDKNSRLFLFYSKEKTNGMILDGYPIIMKEKLSYEDFSEIKVGDSIEKVGNIDSIIPLYIEEFDLMPEAYYEQNKENGKNFSSVHLLSDGILKIGYERREGDYYIIDITYEDDFVMDGLDGKTCYKISEADYVE